jgi:hypothetical protein
MEKVLQRPFILRYFGLSFEKTRISKANRLSLLIDDKRRATLTRIPFIVVVLYGILADSGYLALQGIPYVVFWKNAFSQYAACHFRHALFSVVQRYGIMCLIDCNLHARGAFTMKWFFIS